MQLSDTCQEIAQYIERDDIYLNYVVKDIAAGGKSGGILPSLLYNYIAVRNYDLMVYLVCMCNKYFSFNP